MKLEDLYSYPVLEIFQGSSQDGVIDEETLQQLQPTGTTIEGLTLCSVQIGDQIIFSLNDQDEIMTYIVCTPITDYPGPTKPTIAIQRSFTPEQYQNKGYCAALYYGLARCGYRIVSDLQLSPEAISVWRKIAAKRPTSGFDTISKQPTDKDPFINHDVCIVLESPAHAKQSPLLEDTKYFISSK